MTRSTLSATLAAAGLAVFVAAGGAGAEAAKAKKPKCNGLKATIVASNQDEAVYGTNKPDVIVTKPSVAAYGRGDDDVICGAEEENTTLVAGSGDDDLTGSADFDTRKAGSGDDTLTLCDAIDDPDG